MEVKLVPSRGGRFEVLDGGVPIYEKSKTGRHARPGEVMTLLAAHRARPGGEHGG